MEFFNPEKYATETRKPETILFARDSFRFKGKYSTLFVELFFSVKCCCHILYVVSLVKLS